MDTIKTYLDNVFAAFPQNEKIAALKREMYSGMVEKYQALKREGKSEHEAVGSVIANFGSIEEVIAELGIEKNDSVEADRRVFLTNEKAKAYLEEMKKCGSWIGLGICLIMAGLCVTSFMMNITDFASLRHLNEDVVDGFGILVFFGFIAVAVIIFIVNGVRITKYEDYQKYGVRLDEGTKNEIEEKSNRFNTVFIAQIAAGVALILLAAGSFVLLEELGSERVAIIFMLMSIGIAVFLFVVAGMTKAAFELLLAKGGHEHKAHSKKGERLIGTIAAVYWPFTVAVYLAWSFVFGAWAQSWAIWPIAAVLFAAIAGGIGAWFGQEK
jgi:MFS family permease